MTSNDKGPNIDYLQELEKYLSNLSVADYQTYIEFCLRAPADMRILISEIGRLRNDITRYREDVAALRKEVFDRDKLVSEFRPKANKYDRMVERLQPVDGGQYVNDVVEAFWRYLRDLQVEESGLRLDRAKIEEKLESKVGKSDTSPKRNTPIIDIKRVYQDQDDGQEKTDDEITKPSK
jgi:hypothetical protein